MDSSASALIEFPAPAGPELRSDRFCSTPPEATFESMAVVPSNVRAVESAMRFAGGINSFVALIGPSGWGKSHILEAAARVYRRDLGVAHVPVVSAPDWLADARLRVLAGPLILDNAQDLVNRTRSRIQLQLTLERRVRANKPTLLAFTEDRMTRAIRLSLPQFRDWIVSPIQEPNATERARILRRMADSQGLSLSVTLVRLLANKVQGNGRTLLGALKRLALLDSLWDTPERTLAAAGSLNPFLNANSGWDLREHLAEAANRLPAEERRIVLPFDLAVYVMLQVALLPEDSVAKFFRIEPAKAYAYATRFGKLVDSNGAAAEATARFVRRVVEQF